MAKVKSVYSCQNCGTQHAKWMGKCSQCNEWNTIIEEKISIDKKGNRVHNINNKNTVKRINDVDFEEDQRFPTNSEELNRVLGGGIVPGSLILLGGEPGIGKSTLLLQMALKMRSQKVLYVSGEESEKQIKLRANRIHKGNSQMLLYTDTDIQNIFTVSEENKPNIIIIDSIQTIYSSTIESTPGSVSQIRESTNLLMRFAKQTNTSVFIIGHITKDGAIAGPKLLEHMVDVVLQFEGDRNYLFRILRGLKNRFGATSEIGLYEMQGSGLREVKNPSEIFISSGDEGRSGSAIAVSLEGNRAILLETQALVSIAVYGTPQRSSTGYNNKRLNMLLAVLEKKGKFNLSQKDVFLNIVGGLKVYDPAVDLAVIMAIISSDVDISLPNNVCFSGEVGLSGEVRSVTHIEQRVSEAEKLGFKSIFISEYSKIDSSKYNIKIIKIKTVEEVLQKIFK